MRTGFLLLPILLAMAPADNAAAATSGWMKMAEARRYLDRLHAGGRLPVRLECKAGHALRDDTLLRVTDGPNPEKTGFKQDVNRCSLMTKNKANMQAGARSPANVAMRGGRALRYVSFMRFNAPGSGEAYGCELLIHYKTVM